MTVTIPATGGFELEVVTQISNVQAGVLAAGPKGAVSTVGGIQFAYSTGETTSWTFNWTPPTTNVGSVVLYVTGGGHGTNYSNNFPMTPPAATPPPPPPPPPAPTPTLSVSPTTLSFTYTSGTTTSGSQSVMVSGTAKSYTAAASGGTWLSSAPTTGTPGGAVTVSANPGGLIPGTYNGTVVVTSAGATGSPQTVNVKLTVTAAPTPPPPTPPPPTTPPPTALTLSVSPMTLSFTYPSGTTTSGSQSIMVSGTAKSYMAATSGETWLSATPTTGAPPAPVTVSVKTAGLAPNTYNGTVTIASTGATGSPQIVGVKLVVTAPTVNPPTTVTPVAPAAPPYPTGGCDDGCSTPGGMYAKAYVHDPTQSGALAAAWVDNLGSSPHNSIDPRNQGLVIGASPMAPAGSMAGVVIQNVTGMSLTGLGLDLNAGIQCGANAPQFVVVTADNVTHTVGGCTSSTPAAAAAQTAAPMGWTHLQFDPQKATPPINPTDQVQSISVVLGKGANQNAPTSTQTTGSIAVIDNIEINGMPVGKGAKLTTRTTRGTSVRSRSRDD